MSPLLLPTLDGRVEPYTLCGDRVDFPPPGRIESRRVYAAVHVVADARADVTPDDPAAIDFDTTLAFRHHVWACGLGVAEAMDTAQRGMGLGWECARSLIERTAAEARSVGGAVVSGATTDQLPSDASPSLDEVVAAYEEQLDAVEAAGSRAAIMPSRHLARAATGPDDYLRVYGRLLEQVAEPVILHWLGGVFDPSLRAYWGSDDPKRAAEAVVTLCEEHTTRIDGIKLSLLDAGFERALRARLPKGVRLYSGDDFNYPDLIRGEEDGHSDALLGVFDPLAPIAAHALAQLDRGDPEAFTKALEPTVPFARHLFCAPSRYYKTGVTFIAWLNGHQDHFRMVGGLESARSLPHLAMLARLADQAGVLHQPDLAHRRLRLLLELSGVAQEGR